MKHCPNPECHGLKMFKIISEYEDSASVCADCAAPLVDGPAPPGPEAPSAPADPDPDLELVAVMSSCDESDLLVAESLLAEAGIPYLARGEQIQDLFGMGRLVAVNPITGPVEIMVSADDLEVARELLADFQ